jgi:Lrp/AsnC family transcriptional regulator, leucine-responsive regulatory protein
MKTVLFAFWGSGWRFGSGCAAGVAPNTFSPPLLSQPNANRPSLPAKAPIWYSRFWQDCVAAAMPAQYPANMQLDTIDLKILRALQADARLSNVALADKVGLSPSPCLRRLRLLEEAGVIEDYRAMLDRKKAGFGLTVFVSVKAGPHTAENHAAFLKSILAIPEVVACHLVSGDADYLVEVVCKDMEDYESNVVQSLLGTVSVRDIRSNFAMRSFRAAGPLPV